MDRDSPETTPPSGAAVRWALASATAAAIAVYLAFHGAAIAASVREVLRAMGS